MTPKSSHYLTLLGALAILPATSPATAQTFPGWGGIEARLGVVSPENAQLGLGLSADLDLGYLAAPTLRPILGFNYIRARIDRVDARGTFEATGGRAGLRFDPMGGATLAPYGLASINGYRGRFDLPDNSGLETALEGFNVGVGLGAGLTWILDEGHRSVATVEARRIYVNNLNQWGLEAGLRFQPRGRDTYAVDERTREPR